MLGVFRFGTSALPFYPVEDAEPLVGHLISSHVMNLPTKLHAQRLDRLMFI